MPKNCEVGGVFGEMCRMSENCAIDNFAQRWIDQTQSSASVGRNALRMMEILKQHPQCLKCKDLLTKFKNLAEDTLPDDPTVRI